MNTCSIGGCPKPTVARGWCENHYALWWKNGDPNLKRGRWDGHVKVPHPCSVDGCDRLVLKSRMCTLHSRRMRKSGDPNVFTPRGKQARPPVGERLFAKTRRDGECLIWTGALNSWGYGSFRGPNGETRAHRSAWVIAHGPIPVGMSVLHHCDRPACVEERHLFLGTHQDNMDDMNNKGRDRHLSGESHGLRKHPEAVMRGEANFQARLTAAVVREIRTRYARGETQAELASEYGVTQTTVSRVLLGQTWRHVI